MATLGKTMVGSTTSTPINADNKFVTQVTATEAGYISTVSAYIVSTGNSIQSLLGCVYGASGAFPGALLGQCAQELLIAPGFAGWVDMPLQTVVPMAVGQLLFPGFLVGPTGGQFGFVYDPAAGREVWTGDSFADGPANPFGTITGADQANDLSIYATYTQTFATLSGIKYKQNYAAAAA